MPVTKNQNLRLEILDELLASRGWTLEELLAQVNLRMGTDFNPIDKRTLFRDIKYLIESKDAPVHRPEKADNLYYYTENFSLKNIPLDEDELESLRNALQILKQVDNFYLLKDVGDVIRKLENRIDVQTGDQRILIQFEKNNATLGIEHINNLMEAIKNKITLRISYQPFSHPTPTEKIVHPYLLREFRNRWFILGREGNATRVTNYALDRIKKIKSSDVHYLSNDLFDPSEYFKYLIGVSVPEGAKQETIEIKVYKKSVPYVLSKPIHFNQTTVKNFKDGTILIQMILIINFELKSILLSYGDGIEVRKPKHLQEDLRLSINSMQKLYQ